MAGLNAFAFRPGTSFLHRTDPRSKTLMVCLISLTLLNTGYAGCLILLAVILGCLSRSPGIPLHQMLQDLKWFVLLLALMFLVRSLTTPGEPILSVCTLSVTREGMNSGGLTALRFFLVMVTGMLFSATTRASDVKSTAQWFLTPIPLIPAARVALLIGLSLRFLPLILHLSRQTTDAIRARCGELRKNPVVRIRHQVMPVLKKIFQMADHIALSMEARCYSETRTEPDRLFGRWDAVFLAAGFLMCTAIGFPQILIRIIF